MVAHTADLPAFVDKPLHGALAFKTYVGMFQGALSYAILEEPATLAGDIKPEVARLSHRSRGRKRLAGGEIENEISAGATTHRAQCFQFFDKAGI